LEAINYLLINVRENRSNGQTRDTGNIGNKTQNVEKQNKKTGLYSRRVGISNRTPTMLFIVKSGKSLEGDRKMTRSA
jgi:hypothetical protein